MLALCLLLMAGGIVLSRAASKKRLSGAMASRVGAAAPSLLDWVPEGPLIVVEVDASALRRTPLGKRILGGGRRIAGLGDVGTICGKDPLRDLDRILVAVPKDEQAGFGFFASGAIDAAQLTGCAREIARRRAAKVVQSKGPGDFRLLGGLTHLATATAMAVRQRGPLLLSSRRYIDSSLAAGLGQRPTAANDRQHARLRQLVGPGTLRLTAVLSPQQRASLRRQLTRDQRSASPFLAVSGGGLSLRLGAEVQLVAALTCARPQACAEVARVLNRYLIELAEEPQGKLLGLQELLRNGKPVRAVGATAALALRLPLRTARLLLKLALMQRRLSGSGPPALPPPAPKTAASVAASSLPGASAAPSAVPRPIASGTSTRPATKPPAAAK